jgi:hypothetical protein
VPKSPPKNGRIFRYANEFRSLRRDTESPHFKKVFEDFMSRLFRDCQVYLNGKLGACFPDIRLTFYYNTSDFLELEKKLDLIFGVTPHRQAVVYKLAGEIHIGIDVHDHLIGNEESFVANLCTSYIEELVHIIEPRKSEVDIHEIVCSMIEGFHEMPLTEEIKKERLRIAKEIDESKI